MPVELTSDPAGVSLAARLARETGAPVRLVHRLDRGTRGFVLVALDAAAAAFYGACFAERRVAKLYLARVRGGDASLVGPRAAYLKERAGRVSIVRSGGRPSRLDVVAVRAAPGRPGEAHVLVRLHTGRRHQVRVMLAALGAPLVGDPLYGDVPGPYYLEHALLAFPDCADGRMRVAFDPADPERERIDPALMGMLEETAGGMRGG